MNPPNLTALRKKAHVLKPVLRIGKNGVTESFIEQAKKILKKQPLIKIKLLQSALEKTDRKQAAEQLAEKTGTILVHQTGFVIVLHKKR